MDRKRKLLEKQKKEKLELNNFGKIRNSTRGFYWCFKKLTKKN